MAIEMTVNRDDYSMKPQDLVSNSLYMYLLQTINHNGLKIIDILLDVKCTIFILITLSNY